jgi:uncharacterized membrane protein YgcG
MPCASRAPTGPNHQTKLHPIAMKKLTALLATVLGLGLLTPTTAEAGCRSRSYVDNCGYTVYSEYRCVGRDCHGCPIYRWVVVRRVPPCHGHGGYSGGYHGGGYYRGGHSFSGSYHGGGVHFQWCR